MELNANQIQEIIPHRPPFLLVDRITDYEPGVWAKGRKAVTAVYRLPASRIMLILPSPRMLQPMIP